MKRNLLIACILGYVLCSAILWHSEHRSRIAYERIIQAQREALRDMTELAGRRSADYWSCEAELSEARHGALPRLSHTDTVTWR